MYGMYDNYFLTKLQRNVIKFEINLIFLIKPFFLHNAKVKTQISLERKGLLSQNKKHFFFFLKFSN